MVLGCIDNGSTKKHHTLFRLNLPSFKFESKWTRTWCIKTARKLMQNHFICRIRSYLVRIAHDEEVFRDTKYTKLKTRWPRLFNNNTNAYFFLIFESYLNKLIIISNETEKKRKISNTHNDGV